MNETMEQYKQRIYSSSTLDQLYELYRLAAREIFTSPEIIEELDLISRHIAERLECKKQRRAPHVWTK